MRIAVVHQTLRLVGGGERVCLSLLKALDRTGHDVALRCVEPPHGVSFAGGGGSADGDGAAAGGAPSCEAPCDEECREGHLRLERVGLELAAPDIQSLFRAPGRDLLVVTDGGFVLAETGARRVVLYCNSALREEGRIDHLAADRSPRGRLRYWRAKRADRRLVRAARDPKIVLVPNSRDTMRAVGRLVGGRIEQPVHPPVDLGRFEACRAAPRERRVATVARFAPEKNLVAAARIAARAGERWDAAGNAAHPYQHAYLEEVRRAAGPGARFHVNVGPGGILRVLAGAKAYLHASKETFGIAVAEAVAAGCVPVVPDNSAHAETVPFAELRYGAEDEAISKVSAALDGRYDGLLPGLRDHVRQFSEAAFQERMLGIIEGQG